MNDDAAHLASEGASAAKQTKVGDTAGSPTWPISDESPHPAPPPVGLNWGTVAEGLGVDVRILEHEGLIVLAGEYFPEAGFFIDPQTLDAQHVDVGDSALRHGYFIGNLTAREFKDRLRLIAAGRPAGLPVMRRQGGPIIGLFADELQAKRAKSAVLQGAVGAGIRSEAGPIGVELRVERPMQPGAVASLIASHGGAVISIGGATVAGERTSGALSTAPSLPAAEADSTRRGTGSASDSQAASTEPGGSVEFRGL